MFTFSSSEDKYTCLSANVSSEQRAWISLMYQVEEKILLSAWDVARVTEELSLCSIY